MLLTPRLARALPFVVLAALAVPASAFAQASRTWVSGTGDDVNPCSRTAPCKTFTGAFVKTAGGGEITALDPGGFGSVTITRSLTIDGYGENAGVLSSGVNGITINAPGADVILRYLNFNGIRASTNAAGLDGVEILAAKDVTIEHSRIANFGRNGVEINSTTSATRVYLRDDEIYNNAGNGVFVDPQSGSVFATLTGDEIDQNGCGVSSTTTGGTTSFGTLCGAGTGTGGGAFTNIFDTTISGDTFTSGSSTGTAILANGAGATEQISNDRIVLNYTGLQAANGGTINSWSNNEVASNSTNGTPTNKLTPLVRRGHRR